MTVKVNKNFFILLNFFINFFTIHGQLRLFLGSLRLIHFPYVFNFFFEFDFISAYTECQYIFTTILHKSFAKFSFGRLSPGFGRLFERFYTTMAQPRREQKIRTQTGAAKKKRKEVGKIPRICLAHGHKIYTGYGGPGRQYMICADRLCGNMPGRRKKRRIRTDISTPCVYVCRSCVSPKQSTYFRAAPSFPRDCHPGSRTACMSRRPKR